ncbi:MAG: carboxypeptidase regulatory-like domain-containing protein, partial [Acidobacteria bacterium]|nr:carboxypeptidase regulatory-like domain-containing protein [Candidatus Sulfomarinibacter sp. MAG AM2]
MNRKTVSVLVIVGVLLLFSLSASAQTRTGRILGQVHSADGVPLAGATVTASSEVVMGGSRTAVTGETGAFRFAALPPGIYDVMVTMEGHGPQTMNGISVTISGTGTANFMLMPEFS